MWLGWGGEGGKFAEAASNASSEAQGAAVARPSDGAAFRATSCDAVMSSPRRCTSPAACTCTRRVGVCWRLWRLVTQRGGGLVGASHESFDAGIDDPRIDGTCGTRKTPRCGREMRAAQEKRPAQRSAPTLPRGQATHRASFAAPSARRYPRLGSICEPMATTLSQHAASWAAQAARGVIAPPEHHQSTARARARAGWALGSACRPSAPPTYATR